MLKKGVYLASRGYTPLGIQLNDTDIDEFLGAARDFLVKYVRKLAPQT
jgi:hypothetical protein